jgi:hypothetical protein
MPDPNETAIAMAHARLNVLEGVVRMLFGVMNSEQRVTADDLMLWAERIKSQYESSMQPGSAAYLTAAVDNFFNALVRDLRKDSAGKS